MSKEIDLENLDREYPCDKRGGHAVLKNCNCKDSKGNDKVDKTRIKCLLKNKALPEINCTICVYQRNKFG